MNLRLTVLISIIYLITTCRPHSDQPATVSRLPLLIKEGYGPFHPSFGSLSEDNPTDPFWGKIYLPVEGTPKHWRRLTKSMVWLDSHQLVYQNVLAGNISLEHYKFLQKEWKWVPDTTKLSATPIKCYVHVISGFDESCHKWAVMVDTNNNLDFSDETPIYPQPIDSKDHLYQYKDSQQVHYEIYQKEKIICARIPMVVKTMGHTFLYNFPQFAVASLEGEHHKDEIYISSGFTRPNFERTAIARLPLKTDKIDPQQLVEIGEHIEANGYKYKNKGVDPFNNWLELELIAAQVNEYSLQVGYPLKPFKVNEFSSGKPISLQDFRGKYVYVDFWGTWCKGCVDDIPSLKKAYQELDKTRFEFVGIACHDSPERLRRFLADEQIKWPQILANQTNKLADSYPLTSYPTSVLVDPNGSIIAKNLRGDALRDVLKKLSK